MDKKSRSSIEMNDPSSRPAIAEKLFDMEQEIQYSHYKSFIVSVIDIFRIRFDGV